jgi:PIN domain nuclease of toxin-antitoxin system
MLNLDTHIVIHAMTGDLKPPERKLLAGERWGISGIVFWEIAKLHELGRIEIDLADADVEHFLSSIHVWPITIEVCRAIRELDFDSDPADEIIAATSLIHRVPLLTRDGKILRSKCVPLAKGGV